jgi:hypothetical protein
MNCHVVSSFLIPIMSKASTAGTTVSARCDNNAQCVINFTGSLATLYIASLLKRNCLRFLSKFT